jgi:hypothetical protein
MQQFVIGPLIKSEQLQRIIRDTLALEKLLRSPPSFYFIEADH